MGIINFKLNVLPGGLIALLILGWNIPTQAQTINGTTVTAASCNTTDVQNAINAAAEGDTVMIPAGTCTWTTGVTISGKGITLTGAGSSRIIAISSSTLKLATGTLTLSVTGADPGTTLAISAGQTLTVSELGTETNFMTGTVTSYSSGTLVMNITNTGGSCGSNSLSNCKRWIIATPATTTIINNDTTNTPLFNVSEDTTVHTNIGSFTVTANTGNSNVFVLNYTSGGQAILIHDCRITGNPNNGSPPSGNAAMIMVNTLRGVIWNCSFDSSPYNISTLGAIGVQDDTNVTGNSWTSVSNMGNLDVTGQGKVYIEDDDFHAMNYATSTDNNGRMAIRYSLYDNSGVGTHGADTSFYGQRYFEFYNNLMVFEGYTDGTTFNVTDWFYVRGGTFVIYNNTIPALQSQDYSTKADVNMTVMNLQRATGTPTSCWGAGFSTAGQYYHAPRQIGYGYVTGTGTVTYPPDGYNNTVTDAYTYVGDSEPAYIWGNSRTAGGTAAALSNVEVSDYGGTECTNPDSSVNYIVSGRDYFNTASTAKPGWSPYTFPHPLRSLASAITYGDLNGAVNGQVTIYDAELVAQYVVGLITLTPTQMQEAEVSSSTETAPTIYDAFLIAEYSVGLITQFPVQQ